MTESLKAIEADAVLPPSGAKVTLSTEVGEADIVVPPPGSWRTRANRALREGVVDEWAELVLSAEDFAAWVECDPTNDEAAEFFKAWAEASGEDLGKSRASRRSSRSTARR